jgi:predicted P-loop ATPase
MGQGPSVLDQVLPLARAGAALHWLRPKSKAPLSEGGWSTASVATPSYLERTYRDGYNVGIRTGSFSQIGDLYLHILDVDIRAPEHAAAAWAKVRELVGNPAELASVQSGSGGESRHLYFLTDKPFGSRKLARSEGFEMVPDPVKGRDVKKRHWEVELFGSGKQAAMPPSIHPDTGKPYVWERRLDLAALDLGFGPILDATIIKSWGGVSADAAADDTDAKPALGLTEDESREILADLPLDEWCEDRDGWLQVGMALHHEFDGADTGLDLWHDFSAQSGKYDPDDLVRVWSSFRKRTNSVRMATLKKAAGHARVIAQFEEIEDDDDVGSPEATFDASDLFDDEETRADTSDLFDDEPAVRDHRLEQAVTNPNNKEWRQLLHLNEESGVRPTLHNVELIVRHDPRMKGVMALNDFTQEVVFRNQPGSMKARKKAAKAARQLLGPVWELKDPINGDLWSDAHDNALRVLMEAPTTQGGYGLKVSDRDLTAAVDQVARENAFHPVREYLSGLKWDRRKRVSGLFTKYLGAPDTPYIRDVSRLMMLGAVTRAFEPGHKFDFAVILEGLQGRRKSTFISILARHWFAELDGDFHDTKQMVELMQGSWLMEIPELSGFGRADVRAIKAFISRTTDKARLAYARRASVFPRQCVFIGSTNDDTYLRDDTGGRRFWPIECHVEEIDTEGLSAEIDQFWAEAAFLYRQMRAEKPVGSLPLYLSDEASKIEAAIVQESRRVESAEDGLAGRISEWLDRPVEADFEDLDHPTVGARARTATCLTQIWCEMMGKDLGSYGQVQAQQLGRAMKRVPGWVAADRRRIPKYGQQRVYLRTE